MTQPLIPADDAHALYTAGFEDGQKHGADAMQQAIIDLLNEHNAPLHLVARIVEMNYPWSEP